MMRYFFRGFTLIELLIVVAIIAILAAIAVPNFLEAQVRSKVSKCKTDMRSCATALEAYRVDSNRYPADNLAYSVFGVEPWKSIGQAREDAQLPRSPEVLLYPLTTPMAYITAVPPDIFNVDADSGPQPYIYVGGDQVNFDRTWPLYNENNHPSRKYGAPYGWILSALGPDRVYSGGNSYIYTIFGLHEREVDQPNGQPYNPPRFGALYDATNGSVSWGDVVRVGP